MECADNLDVATSGLVSNSLTSYQPLPMDLKEQWRILEEAKSVPFSKWDLQAVTAWFEVGLGEFGRGGGMNRSFACLGCWVRKGKGEHLF